MALAHMVQNGIEAGYAQSDMFARRRRLLAAWSTYDARGDRLRPDVVARAMVSLRSALPAPVLHQLHELHGPRNLSASVP